jgi:D-methionine transport system substrate-binding protein
LQCDAIAVEEAKGSFANLIARRTEDKDKPWVKKLAQAYQSGQVRQFIEAEFKGSLIPAF